MIDREKADVYSFLLDGCLRAILTVVLILSFVVLLIFAIRKPNVYLTVLTGVMPLSITIMFKYYYRSPSATKRNPTRKKKGKDGDDDKEAQ